MIVDAELNLIRDHLRLHAENPQREPLKGYELARSYVRFAAWALPRLIEHGEIVVDVEHESSSSRG